MIRGLLHRWAASRNSRFEVIDGRRIAGVPVTVLVRFTTGNQIALCCPEGVLEVETWQQQHAALEQADVAGVWLFPPRRPYLSEPDALSVPAADLDAEGATLDAPLFKVMRASGRLTARPAGDRRAYVRAGLAGEQERRLRAPSAKQHPPGHRVACASKPRRQSGNGLRKRATSRDVETCAAMAGRSETTAPLPGAPVPAAIAARACIAVHHRVPSPTRRRAPCALLAAAETSDYAACGMRICVVFDCLYPYTVGGAERWYRGLVERLAEEGHEVTYLTLRQWRPGEAPSLGESERAGGHAGGREGGLEAERERGPGRVRVASAGPPMRLYVHGRRRILPALVFGAGVLAHMLRDGRDYDAVHVCATPFFSLLAAACARPAARYRLVVDWPELWSERYWRSYLGAVGGRVGYLVQRLCARLPQRAFCFSRMHAQRLRSEGCSGPVTILRGLYAGAGAATETSSQPDAPVVFAGRLIPEKRAPLAVAAFARAAARIDGLRGEFYGDGPERQALLAAIAEHEVQDLALAPGFVEEQTIDRAMGRALCMLSTSEREGYGLVVVEAAARGTPSIVVAGQDNAATELIEEGVNGFVVESEDPEAIAAAIVRVHAAGEALRQSTASWFARNAEPLSLERSLAMVLDSYGAGTRSSASSSA